MKFLNKVLGYVGKGVCWIGLGLMLGISASGQVKAPTKPAAFNVEEE